jgi:hypothetical protein
MQRSKVSFSHLELLGPILTVVNLASQGWLSLFRMTGIDGRTSATTRLQFIDIVLVESVTL